MYAYKKANMIENSSGTFLSLILMLILIQS